MRHTIRDQSGCLHVFGAAFVLSGTLALTMLIVDGGRLGFWGRVAVVAIGAAHIAAGAWTMIQSPPRRVEVDVARRQLIVQTRTLRSRATKTYEASELSAGRIVEDRDSDGDPIFTAQIRTRDAAWIPLTSTPRRSRDEADRDLQLVYQNLLSASTHD